GAVAGKPARAERGKAPLMREFRQRIGLVHELRELRAPEELLNCSDDGTDVHQLARRRLLGISDRHAFPDYALHAEQSDPELVLDKFAHCAHTPVAQMVDVIRLTTAVVQTNDFPNDSNQVRSE